MAESAQEEKKRPAQVDDKIHTWPHLVRVEFLVALFVMVVLIIWSIVVDAPLEEPANPTRTPNPSKAPWYFLGLQEMLVYFDPWYAGVVLPSFIIVGLMIIPFIDINPKGNGYYTFKERKYEILTFYLGFHILWVSMIIIGTFFRGPGWNLFWPWERWDPYKVVAMTNVDLPYLFGFRDYVWSSVFGGLCTLGYYLVGMWAFYRWVIWVKGKEFMVRWGAVRFSITAFFFVTMLGLPVKMFLRLAFNVKYIWVTPWFNI
ncbi:MAG: cytochrome C [Candidatus Binatia bacterium]